METVTKHIKIDDDFINEHDSPFEVIAPVWWTASIYDGEEKYNKSLGPFSREQQYIYAILWYLFEVENGGHYQFYSNSTGIVWKDAMSGFKALGLDEVVEIISESANRLGGNPNLDKDNRNTQLDKYDPDFNDLDSQLYKLDNVIYEGIYQYILNNRNAFFFDGEIQIPKHWDETNKDE